MSLGTPHDHRGDQLAGHAHRWLSNRAEADAHAHWLVALERPLHLFVGLLVYPTAPPRLAGVGIVDTVSGRHVDLIRGLVSALYDRYAALPSMHIGYELIVATGLLRHGRRLVVRAIGALYPPFVLLVIVATGNQFFLDAVAGALVAGFAAALVAGLAAALAALLTRRPATDRG